MSRHLHPGRLTGAIALLIASSSQIVSHAGEAPSAHLSRQTVRLADGKSAALNAPAGGALALVFCSSECPISNAYSPTLNGLVADFPADKLRLIGIFVDPDHTDVEVADHAKEFRLAFPVASDRTARISTRLGVKVTPEVVVVDDKDRVRYQGRIDDQFAGRGKPNANPATHELRDAIAAILAGREVAKHRVEAVGCPLPEPLKEPDAPTYSGGVAEILDRKCVECHRPGQVGPFSLVSYAQARKRAADIADTVESRRMPPWKPAPGFGGPFKHDRSLTDAEIDRIVAWADAGAPEGEPVKREAPRAPTSADSWTLGTPDVVIEIPEDFAIPADGGDIYRCFVIPSGLTADRYVSAVEYRPRNRSVVHHMIGYVDTSGKARERDRAEAGGGYTCFSGPMFDPHSELGGWAPGNEPNFLPEGIGRSLPRGADVVLQMHYHPSGKPETDRSKIGIHFSKTPVKQVIRWAAVLNQGMVLPKDNPRIEVIARWRAPVDLDAYAVTPHMHLLGKDIAISVTDPDGKTRPLVRIDDWDFHWQNTYYFERPFRIKKGSLVDLVAHYDNSSANPRNPNKPPKEVRWGEATTDEMCLGFLAVTKARQDLTRPGQVDDLGQILEQSYKDQQREYEERQEKKSP